MGSPCRERMAPERASPHNRARISLLRTWPELATSLSADQRVVAERALTAPVLRATGDRLTEAMAPFAHEAFNFLIVEGAVIKETSFAGRSALEILSPGDVLAPTLTPDQQIFSRATSDYHGLGEAALAVLDDRFKAIAQRWPNISTFLHDRLAQQTHRASLHLAMMHLTRVEDRILALFTDLSERFGRMTLNGIIIDLPLTHDLIGHIVGSARPTVTLALTTMTEDGTLCRLDRGRWLLATG